MDSDESAESNKRVSQSDYDELLRFQWRDREETESSFADPPRASDEYEGAGRYSGHDGWIDVVESCEKQR